MPGRPSEFDEIVQEIREKLPPAPSFRRKLVHVPLGLDFPYWIEDAGFELEFHMRHIALTKPGDWKQFRTQVARLAARGRST